MYLLMRLGPVALAVAALSFFPAFASASPGDLDPSFGVGGLSAPAAPANYSYSISDVAVQPDGKIVAVGSEQFMSGPAKLAVQRFNADGSVDDSFGASGVAVMTYPSTTFTGYAVRLTTDGTIVVGGEAVSGSNFFFMSARFTSTGQPDTSYDGDASNLCGGTSGNGLVCTQVSATPGTDRGWDLALQPDGKAVVVGSAYSAAVGYSQNAAVRYTTTGALDSSFDGDGRAIVNVGSGGWDSWARSVSMTSDGKFVLAGGLEAKGPNHLGADVYVYALGFVRLDENGAVDPGFHSVPGSYTGPPYTIGTVVSPRADWTYGEAYDADLQSDGKLVAVGYANDISPSPTASSALVVRITTGGELDTSYGIGGRTFSQVGAHAGFYGVKVDSAGRAVINGYAEPGGVQTEYSARFTTGGAPDTGFAHGAGARFVDWASGGSSGGQVAIQPDGRLLLVGGGNGGGRTGLARLLTAEDPPPPEPTLTITSPNKRSLKASKLRSFSGTAGPAGSVKKVEIALQRKDSKLLKKKRRCLWLSGSKAKFKKTKATKGKCSKPYFRKAVGTTKWKYRLTKTLPVGSYALTARVTLNDGRSASKTFSFKLKRK